MAVQLTNEFIQGAQQTERDTGIPASITLGQIILESSGKYKGGLSGLAYNDKNLFGVKGTGTAGSSLYSGGRWFKKYNSYAESIADHARILTLGIYTKYFKNATSLKDFASGLQNAGYAGDSTTYASQLMDIIKNNGLTKYDTGQYKFKGETTSAMTTEQANEYIKQHTAANGAEFKEYYDDSKNKPYGGGLNDWLDDGDPDNNSYNPDEAFQEVQDERKAFLNGWITSGIKILVILVLIIIVVLVSMKMIEGSAVPA